MNESWQRELVAALLDAPEHVNPALALAVVAQRAELEGNTEFLAQAAQSGAAERAISEGVREGEDVLRALQMLGQATPAASQRVPEGF